MRTLTPERGITIRTVEGPLDLAVFATWLQQRRLIPLGIDCESNAVDQFAPRYRLRAVQVADAWESWVIDPTKIDLRVLARMIHAHPLFVAHYAEADIRFLVQGCPGAVLLESDIPHIVDSQVALAWFEPRTVTSRDDAYDKRLPLPRGLKPGVERILDTRVLSAAEDRMHAKFRSMAPSHLRKWKEEVLPHGYANIPFADDDYTVYAGLDPLQTIRLWHVMADAIRRRGQERGFTDDLALQWHLDRATLRGLGVDGPYAAWLDDQLSALIQSHMPLLAHMGIPSSGMGTSVGVALEFLGAVSPKVTQHGAKCWDKTVLAELSEQTGQAGELARAVIAVRKAAKFRSTYIAPMLASLPHDGRVHCSFRVCGTITSRNSAMRPPVQQLPKKDTRVRAAIKARPGYVFVSCDLSQGEPRTMAALSGDRNLLADILAGDLNGALASATFGDVYDPAQGQDAGTIHYLMRQGAKVAFLAWCYGAGESTVARALGIQLDRGHEITARWVKRYPDLARYRNDTNAGRHVVLDNGWVAPFWDRVRMTDDGRIVDTGRPSRKGLNYATQGNQRQLLAAAVHRLVAWGWSWALVMLVHDEVLFEVPLWMAEQAKAALEAAMTTTYRGVPIECHADVLGTTWAKQPDEFDIRELDAVAL